jgi:hypothetical protein
MSIIGNKHSFKNFGIQIGTRQFASLKSIKHDPTQVLDYAYGTGNEPQDLVDGNRAYTGTIVIERQELTFLLNDYNVNTILDLPPVALIEKSENGLGQLSVYTYTNAKFESQGHSINQGDPESPIEIPFKALGVIRS